MLVVNGEDFGSQLRPGAGWGGPNSDEGKGPTSSFFPAFKSPGRFEMKDQPSFRIILHTILIEFKFDPGEEDILGASLHLEVRGLHFR